jgi:hypothetical protein
MIKEKHVYMAYSLIVGKVMHKYMKGEYTMDTIIVVEFCKNDVPMNWYKYLLTKLFQDFADVHDRASYFIYCYLLVSFSMWKWKPSWGGIISHNVDGRIAKLFDP